MGWACSDYLQILVFLFFSADISSGVISNGLGSLFTGASLSVVFHACPQLTSHPCVEYYMIMGYAGCSSAVFCGAIYILKFTGNTASKSGTLHLVSVIALWTCQNGFFLQSSVYISVIGILFASVGLCWSYRDTFSVRGIGVPRGPCFHCCASCGLFNLRLTWCVVFVSLYLFGGQDPPFFPTRVPYMLGVSVNFGNWLTCHSKVWAPPWSAGVILILFACHNAYLFFTFTYPPFYCSYLVLKTRVGRV